jgi:membrane protein DedA with SNARE-associated domain
VLSHLTLLLDRFGYAAVAAMMVVEGLGIPIPAETMLVTAAALAGRGKLSLLGVIIAATAGGIIGGSAGYAIGAKGGVPLIHRFGKRTGVNEERLARAHAFFQDHGRSAAFLARFIALFRLIVPMFAGVARMPFVQFSLYNAAGSFAAAVVYGLLGYQFGRDLPSLERHVALVSVVAIAAGAMGSAYMWRRRKRRVAGRRTETANE